jgi:hypothetical protein
VKIPAAGEVHEFAVFEAPDYASGQIVWPLCSLKDGTAFVAFLDHLVAALPDGSMIIVLDNVGYHKGRLAMDQWMAHHDGVRPLRPPAYAP